MKIFHWKNLRETPTIETVVVGTIGVFDGFHLGHKAMLSRLKALADGKPKLVVTFNPNPKKVLNPTSYAGDLLPFKEKTKMFKDLGVDILVVIDFSLNFSKIDGKIFFLELLRHFRISKLIWGYDFSFGSGSNTNQEHILKLENKPEIVDVLPICTKDKMPISSSHIRKLILSGDITVANELLGYHYGLYPIKRAEKIGCYYSVPRKNLEQVFPAAGLYYGEAQGKKFDVIVTEDEIKWLNEVGHFDFPINLIAKK